MTNHLQDILVALARAEVKFVIVGGVAVVLHGVERMTLDLDLVVEMSRENLEQLIKVLTEIDLVPRAPEKPQILLDVDAVRRMREEKHAIVFSFWDKNNMYRQVDIFITPTPSYHYLLEDSREIVMSNLKIQLASTEKLIQMKRELKPMRPKDISDIEALMDLKVPRK
jgi:hypothetical protein